MNALASRNGHCVALAHQLRDAEDNHPHPVATLAPNDDTNLVLLRPSAAYLQAHAGPDASPLDDAPPGSAREDWMRRAYWREQTSRWLRLHAKLYTRRDHVDGDNGDDERAAYDAAQAAHAAYQRTVAAELAAHGVTLPTLEEGQVLISAETVVWWREMYSLLQWDGALYRPQVPPAEIPSWVLAQTLVWYQPLGPYPPASVPADGTAGPVAWGAQAARSTKSTHAPTAIVPLFASSVMADIPSDKFTRAITVGIRGVEPFTLSDAGVPVTIISEKNIDTKLTVREISERTNLTDEERAMYRTVAEALGDQEADYLRMALALYTNTPARLRDNEGYISVPIDDFLDARGVVRITDGGPGKGWHRTEDKEGVATRFTRLSMLRVEVIDRRDAKALIRETAVMSVDVLKTPDGRTPTDIQYKPGRWRDESLLLLPAPQLALTNQWVYRFDPHNQKWEKRIAEYLTDALRIGNRRAITREVGEILTATGLMRLYDPRKPKKMRDRFEKALRTLVLPEQNHPDSAIISGWAYTDPARVDKMPSNYGWFNPWSRLQVIIQATPHTAARNQERAAKKDAHTQAAAAPAARRKRGRPRKEQSTAQERLPHMDEGTAE